MTINIEQPNQLTNATKENKIRRIKRHITYKNNNFQSLPLNSRKTLLILKSKISSIEIDFMLNKSLKNPSVTFRRGDLSVVQVFKKRMILNRAKREIFKIMSQIKSI
jgi:hypothetical protein